MTLMMAESLPMSFFKVSIFFFFFKKQTHMQTSFTLDFTVCLAPV